MGGDAICFWDVATAKKLREVSCSQNTPSGFAISRDGKVIAAAGGSPLILREVATGKQLATIREAGGSPAVALAPDGKTVAASVNRNIGLWEWATGKQVACLPGPPDPQNYVAALAFAPDGKTLACALARPLPGPSPCSVLLLDVATGKEPRQLSCWGGPIWSLAFAPDGKSLAAAEGATTWLWDVATGEQLLHLKQMDLGNGVAFTPDGKTLVIGSPHEGVALVEVASGKVRRRLQSFCYGAGAVVVSPDGRLLAAVGQGTIRLWDLETGQETPSLDGHRHVVYGLAYSPDGRTLATRGGDNSLCVWDAHSGRQLCMKDLRAEPGSLWRRDDYGPAHVLAFAPDGRTLVSALAGRTLPGWDVATGTAVFHLEGGARSVAFSPDGKTVASGGGKGDIWLKSLPPAGEPRELHCQTRPNVYLGPTEAMAFSPDGKTLAVGLVAPSHGSAPGLPKPETIYLWDVQTGQERLRLAGHAEATRFLAFSPDGTVLASAGGRMAHDPQVRLWEVATGKELATLRGDAKIVQAVAFSADGRLLASAGDDGTVRVWEVATRQEICRFTGDGSFLLCVAFSPDGKALAAGGMDPAVLVWDLSLSGPTGPQELTPQELPDLWADLAGKNATTAYQAVGKLSAAPRQALPFLEGVLGPASEADPLPGGVELGAGKQLQRLRALLVLERIGSAEAQRLVEKVAQGASGARETRDAQATLARLRRH
jgi:WD40 repeat protein